MWVGHVVNKYNVVLMLQLLCILPESIIHVRARYVCEVGQEEKGGKRWRWVLSHKDQCRCTKIRFGGSNVNTPERSFNPVYVDKPLIGDNVEKIMEHYGLDCTDPEIASCPEDLEMETDPGKATAMVVYQTPTATDNSGKVSVMCHPPPGSEVIIGQTSVTCVALDSSENRATCHFQVEIHDKESPEFDSCPSNPMESNSEQPTAMINPMAHDNSGDVPAIMCNFVTGTDLTMRDLTVECVAIDNSGNKKECLFQVKVTEALAIAACPPDQERDTDPGENTTIFVYQTPTPTDPSGEVSVVCYPPPGSQFAMGQTAVMCVVRDSSGNNMICDFQIAIKDNEPPRFNFCPLNPMEISTDPGQPTAMFEWSNPMARDNSGKVPTISCDYASGTSFDIGETTVHCEAVDNSGNSKECQFKVHVLDGEAPVFASCPEDKEIPTDPGKATTMVVYQTPTATDNSGEAINVVCNLTSGQAFPIGKICITCAAQDASENSVTCDFEVNIKDMEAPKIICPTGQDTVTDPNKPTAIITYPTPTGTDNSGVVNVVCDPPSGFEFPIGLRSVTCEARDSSGNSVTCDFQHYIKDKQAPAFASCVSYQVVTDPGKATALVVYQTTATDNSDEVSVVCDPLSGSEISIGHKDVTCVAQDNSANSVTCNFQLEIKDNEPPEFEFCPAIPVQKKTDMSKSTAMIDWDNPMAHDNSGEVPTVTCDHMSGSDFVIGVTTVECVAADGSGNEKQCHFEVHISDVEAPVIYQCPTDIVMETDPGEATALVVYRTPTATDNSGEVITVVCSPLSDSAFPIGRKRVTCTARDSSDNSNACTFRVQIKDEEKPVMVPCPENPDLQYETPDATDNSGEVGVVCFPLEIESYIPNGITKVACVARDGSGNSITCNFEVNFADSYCSTGWDIIGYPNINSGNLVMIAVHKDIPCNGFVTEWRFYTKESRPLKVIMWRHESGDSFQVVGINTIDINPDQINKPIIYVVPESERIEVQAGDMIGWASDHGVLAYDYQSDTLIQWSSSLDTSSLTVNDHYEINGGSGTFDYAIRATVNPFQG
ncbi:hyalin-like [Amphiura filiformis]|uniref:hyalin-like n=1 Tax=Amphiura filiformis TaxID=82378 RepID=UPI003B213AF2